MRQFLFPLALVVVLGGKAGSEPPAPKLEAKTPPELLVTRSYDLKAILGSKLEGVGGASPDAVVRLILDGIRTGELRPATDGPQLVERDGGTLEVRATELVHGQIKQLLDALARLADLAVDVKADLVEFDPAAFEKEVAPLRPAGKDRAGPSSVVTFTTAAAEKAAGKEVPTVATADRLVRAGRVVQTSAGRQANGAESVVSARQAVFTYSNQPGAGSGAAPLFGKEGYRLGALAVVSNDRQTIRLMLTEQSVAVVGEKQRTLGEVGGKAIVATTPDVSEFGKSTTVEVPDGGAILFRLDYAPKDKVWAVVVRPKVFVQAEEAEKKKPENK